MEPSQEYYTLAVFPASCTYHRTQEQVLVHIPSDVFRHETQEAVDRAAEDYAVRRAMRAFEQQHPYFLILRECGTHRTVWVDCNQLPNPRDWERPP